MAKLILQPNFIAAAILTLTPFSSATTEIHSPRLTNWGTWHRWENCPPGTFAHGFELKVEREQGKRHDDTALNGIKLYCAPQRAFEYETAMSPITSGVGPWGDWNGPKWCRGGAITGFELRSEPYQGYGTKKDDTAANNIKMRCTRTGGATSYIDGGGLGWGRWTGQMNCPRDMAVCGIETQVEGRQGTKRDDTALNNIKMKCCNLSGRRMKRSAPAILSSFELTSWGTWHSWQDCPPNTYVHGFQLLVERELGKGHDDTALNGIRLFCSPKDGFQYNDMSTPITSGVGPWGTWRTRKFCTVGPMTGFELRSEPHQGNGLKKDDTAANNLRLRCTALSNGRHKFVDGGGLDWGYWTGQVNCHTGYALCGLQTQVEPAQGKRRDDTTLNNVRMRCCKY